MLAEISQLEADIQAGGSRTLGEHFAKLHEEPHRRIRGCHTRRAMFEREFNEAWLAQKQHHATILTDQLKDHLHGLIFFQRKMYWPKSVIGCCELEPKQKRCPRGDRLAQRFRLLQEVNNLRFIDPATGDEQSLSPESRTLLLDKLSRKKELTFDEIRRALGFLESIRFNLEAGGRTKLQGMVTDAVLANKKLFGETWHARPDGEKTATTRTLLDPSRSDDELLRLATTEWGLSVESARGVLSADLPDGYVRLSRMALQKLLPHMERGLLFMTGDATPSALSEAGYPRPDQREHIIRPCLPTPPEVTNPVVRQALFELRKVVNAIVREYGKPKQIRLELARNAKATSEERRKLSQRMRDRHAERDAAAETIREHGVRVTKDAIDRYLFWQEQHEACVYTGKVISMAQLLGGEVAIDHILPHSCCLDDSFTNKVVCFRDANDEKGNRTPYQWLADTDPKRFEQIRQRAAHLSYNKRRRFTQKTVDLNDFIERQLNDTRYISRVVLEYVRCLCERPSDVLCPKGSHTATLRRHWGLDTVLRELPNSPLWSEKTQSTPGEKDRSDHRHHAIDAIVIALTDHSRLQELARLERRSATDRDGEIVIDPWPGFREDVKRLVNGIAVSHRPRRKVAGALHEDTIYGPTAEKGVFVVRKPLESLTGAMIDDIRDETIKSIVVDRLRKHGIEYGRGKAAALPKEVWREPLTMPSGVPIRRVRVLKSDLTVRPIRQGSACVKPGAIHHVCLFEHASNGRVTRDGVFVTMLEAARRIRDREPLIQPRHPDDPKAIFLMTLTTGDMLLAELDGKERLVLVSTLVSTQQRIHLVSAYDARRSGDKSDVGKTPNSLKARKVAVDPLGRVRWTNDWVRFALTRTM